MRDRPGNPGFARSRYEGRVKIEPRGDNG